MAVDRWPDAFLIGAGRSGTTSLYEMLGQHPQIRVCSQKSPNYFVSGIAQPAWETPIARQMARHWISNPDDYLSMFEGARREQVLIDVSPVYLQALGVAEQIKSVNADARLIAVLRDPADRAFAHFVGRRRDGIEETPSFSDWMTSVGRSDLPSEVSFGHYIGCGQYFHFLRPYFEQFGEEQILILFYEDFVADPDNTLRRLLHFLGVNPELSLQSEIRRNVSGEIESPLKRRLWTQSSSVRTRLRPLLPARLRNAVGSVAFSQLSKATIDPVERSRVIELLRPDIVELQRLTGRNLISWLE